MTSSATPRSSHFWRGDAITVALLLLWLLLVRSALDCPWGFAPVVVPDGLQVGIPANVGDAWFYLSWAQQYREGHFGASILYTTEPHASLLFILPLWLSGKLSAVTGLPLLGVHSTLGALAAAAAAVAFRRSARTLGFDRSATNWATVALVLGSGSSWCWHFLHRAGLAPAVQGAEFFYTDLFPSTAFIVHPYHAEGLALVTALWWATAVAEQRLTTQRRALLALSMVAGLNIVLTLSRPYEPLGFAAVYGLRTLFAFATRHKTPAAWPANCTILLTVILSLGPGLAWNAWISRQPIWSDFAHLALIQDFPRIGWLVTFAGFWLLAAFGSGSLLRRPHLRVALPFAAAAFSFVLLLGLPHAPAKLASGLAVGLALLAGASAAALVRWLRAHLRPIIVVPLGALLLSGFFGTPSLAMALLEFRLTAQATIDSQLEAITRQIPPQSDNRRTIVLTDTETGGILPGWLGVRVYAGHLAVTKNFEAKRDALRSAGLDPAHLPLNIASIPVALDALLLLAHPDVALLDHRCTAAATALVHRGWSLAAVNEHWLLLRSPATAPVRIR